MLHVADVTFVYCGQGLFCRLQGAAGGPAGAFAGHFGSAAVVIPTAGGASPAKVPHFVRPGAGRQALLCVVVGIDDGDAHRKLDRNSPEEQFLGGVGGFLDGPDAGVHGRIWGMDHDLVMQEEHEFPGG